MCDVDVVMKGQTHQAPYLVPAGSSGARVSLAVGLGAWRFGECTGRQASRVVMDIFGTGWNSTNWPCFAWSVILVNYRRGLEQLEDRCMVLLYDSIFAQLFPPSALDLA